MIDLDEEQKKAYDRFIRARDRVGIAADAKPRGGYHYPTTQRA